MKPISVVKIDVVARTVTRVELVWSLENLRCEIGCQTVDGFALDNHYCFCDDEGLLGRPAGYFTVDGSRPIAGNAIVVGPAPQTGRSRPVRTAYASYLQEVVAFHSADAFDPDDLVYMEVTGWDEQPPHRETA